MDQERIYYKEDVSFPLPGTRIRSRQQLIVLWIVSSVLLVVLLPVAFVLIAGGNVDTLAKGFYLVVVVIAIALVFIATMHWTFPKLKSSLPIVVSSTGIRMPVTVIEKVFLLRKSLIRPNEISHVEIRKSKEWDSNASLELVLITRANRVYRSSAKEPSAIQEIARLISGLWPEIRVLGIN